jgi:hypothetical protein
VSLPPTVARGPGKRWPAGPTRRGPALLVWLLMALAACSPHGSAGHPGAGGSSPAAPASPTPSPVSSTAWSEQVVPLMPAGSGPEAPGTPYAASSGAIYGLAGAPFRYQAGGGAPVFGPSIPDASGLVLAGSSVWVVTNPGASDTAELYQLDPASLSVVSRQQIPVPLEPLPGSGGEDAVQEAAVAASAGSTFFWLGAGTDLFKVNVTSGTWSGPYPAGEEIDSMSIDPNGRLLYLGGQTLEGTAVAKELNATTGTTLRQVSEPAAIAGIQVSATGNGVWISFRGGLAGSAELLSATGLARLEPPAGFSNAASSETYEQIGGLLAEVSDGVLWVSGPSVLACADPATAAVKASEVLGSQVTIVAATGVLYASDPVGLAVIDPPAVCFGSR